MIRWKDSVGFDALHPAIVLALIRADHIYASLEGVDCWVTSLNDSRHMEGSLHYTGRAADLRTYNLKDPEAVAAALASALGPSFDVVLESDHLHLEYQP